ncbi:hypothetical protein CN188_04405 [Sinorhizobium meliloti]|uniref:hypothetical protein n=1 Tax=Rhizobium meliloti TaxID=382 RepID=UPI000FD9BAA4|nr:hypothetical protein [Sinorhizobium meliloti]RVI86935.1 hypothetical protein CN188_04405 [Sinorhizobium meliloti]
MMDTDKQRNEQDDSINVIGDQKPGDVPYPDPYWSTPAQSAYFQVVKSITENGVVKSFQGAEETYTLEKCRDQRVVSLPKYWDTPMRKVDQWQFTAVRTVDAVGQDRSIVSISGRALNTWNIFRPRDGVLMSRNGFSIDFSVSHQVLHTVVTGRNFTGNLNRRAATADTITIIPFDIPNNVFEAFDSVTIRGHAEMYYGCP